MKRVIGLLWPPVLVLVVAVVGVDALVRFDVLDPILVPRPAAVYRELAANMPELLRATRQTAIGAGAGMGLTLVIGLAVAILLATGGPWVRRSLYPYTVFFQTVPLVAVAPILVIWFGTGLGTVVACSFICSVFPMIASATAGLMATDPALRDLFRLYGAGPLATLFRLRLPMALPSILTGARIAGGLAVIGAIVGEFFVTRGLASVIDGAKVRQNNALVVAAVLMAAALGLSLFWAVSAVSWFTLRHWYAGEKDA